MQLVKTQALLREALSKTNPATTGFVPTMGALHEGHLSLVRRSAAENELTIISIFVNPTQFTHAEDLDKYPRTLPADIEQLATTGADLIIYAPAAADLYPDGMELKQPYEIGSLETVLEGEFRPGHFQGVSQVVDLLLQAVRPGKLYMGQKDFQQCMVVGKLIADRHPAVRMEIVPTMREENGLAMSSRNQRLSEEEKQTALVLSRELSRLKQWQLSEPQAEASQLTDQLTQSRQAILEAGFSSIDYLTVARPEDLSSIEKYHSGDPAVILVAATLGPVRLIDNMVIS